MRLLEILKKGKRGTGVHGGMDVPVTVVLARSLVEGIGFRRNPVYWEVMVGCRDGRDKCSFWE